MCFCIRTNEHSHIALNSAVESCIVHCYALYIFIWIVCVVLWVHHFQFFNLSHHFAGWQRSANKAIGTPICWAHKLNGNSNDPVPAAYFNCMPSGVMRLSNCILLISITRRRTNAHIIIISIVISQRERYW